MRFSQTGWIFILLCVVVSAFVLANNPAGAPQLICICAVIILLFYRLTVIVKDDHLRFAFGIGIIGKTIYFKDLVACRPIDYMPFGYGVRIRPTVTLYNVSGRKAIELIIRGKRRKIWIGTDKPVELASYINTRLQEYHERALDYDTE
ncbi:hypothetical protein EYV94_16090 [Puteibacter caeruleilacunae]|nr:hypothetical protein EYV94_16090 [Puteibacter caeruleilacunae]